MSALNEEDRANLAAFLDGELDETTSQALEAKLNRDPQARDEVEALRQAWSMLDFLPRPESSPNFTNRTMERLTLIVPRAQSTLTMDRKPPGPSPMPLLLAWGAVVLLALAGSVVAGRFLWQVAEPEPVYVPPSDDWLLRQPKAHREQAAALQGKDRDDFIKRLHQEEQRRDKEWQDAQRNLPSHYSDLPSEILRYYEEYLRFMLTKEERERLDKAEGNWPLFPQTLVELADIHPPALPGQEGCRSMNQLPSAVRDALKKIGKQNLKAIEVHEKQWPGFAMAVSALAYSKSTSKKAIVFPYELWPTHERCLLPPMQDFLNKKLRPALSDDEVRTLNKAVGKWPEFPRTIQELARDHKLQPPWFTFPGPPEQWDSYRIHKKQ